MWPIYPPPTYGSPRPANADAAHGKHQPHVGTVKGHTLAGGFSKSLKELVQELGRTQPHFIRCIKPNEKQQAKQWDEALVQRQLKYSGVMETTTIRKVQRCSAGAECSGSAPRNVLTAPLRPVASNVQMGYPVRNTFEAFVKQYKILAFGFGEDPPYTAESCQKICEAALADEDYQVAR